MIVQNVATRLSKSVCARCLGGKINARCPVGHHITYMREGLRKVAERFPPVNVILFRKQTEMVCRIFNSVKQCFSFVNPADGDEIVN